MEDLLLFKVCSSTVLKSANKAEKSRPLFEGAAIKGYEPVFMPFDCRKRKIREINEKGGDRFETVDKICVICS